jgi:XTP/dITP diphosphohydrolase
VTHQIVLATRNLGKVAELERMLAEHASGIHVLGLQEFPNLPDVEETGSTFIENALLKAREVSEYTGLPALADDSGLCIDALNGDPGIFSARWAGEHGNDGANIEKVLTQLKEVAAPLRTAHFQCAVALHLPSGVEVVKEGRLDGAIVDAPRGSSGFGYDPIFLPENSTSTLGQMLAGEKDSISHRGRAIAAMIPELVKLFA